MFVYTTERDYTVRCKSHLTAKKTIGGERRGREGDNEAVKVISEGVCAADRPQTAVAKYFESDRFN